MARRFLQGRQWLEALTIIEGASTPVAHNVRLVAHDMFSSPDVFPMYFQRYLPSKVDANVWGRSPGAPSVTEVVSFREPLRDGATSGGPPRVITSWTDAELQSCLMPNDVRDRLRALLRVVSQRLEQHKVRYWITGGTLLGAVRHQGFIPWDDDVDICVDAADESRLLDALDFPEKLEFSPIVGYKVYDDDADASTLSKTTYGLFLDIFFMQQRVPGFYEQKRQSARDLWPREVWPHHCLFPLLTYTFEGLEVQGPAQARQYLDTMYPVWDTWAVVPRDDGHGRILESELRVPVGFIPKK